MDTKRDPLAALRRRLEKAELEHLRRHAADLAERLEMMEERALHAEDQADWYWQQHLDLINSLTDEGETLGMTKDGRIGVVSEPVQDQSEPAEPWKLEIVELHRLGSTPGPSGRPLSASFLRSGHATHSDQTQEMPETPSEEHLSVPVQDRSSQQ